MQSRRILEYLEDLAEKFGIEIIYEKLGDKEFSVEGGLCRVKGNYKIFLDRTKSLSDRIEIFTRALSSFEREGIYLTPLIREILEKAESNERV